MSKYDIADLVESNTNVSLPTCPAVFAQLVNILEDPDSGSIKLNEVLSADQALCSQVLRLANSAAFGMERQVASVDEAVLRIGFQNIWLMAIALKSRETLASSSQWSDINELMWWHAFKVAIFSRYIGKQINPSMAPTFFTAGLLHDLGKWVLLQVVPNYVSVCGQGRVSGSVLVALERARLETDHAHIGADLISFWRLPDIVVKLVRSHHDVEPGTFGVMGDQYVVPMSDEMVHLTDNVNEDLGLDPDSIFPSAVIERAMINRKFLAMMIAEYQRLRDILKKPL